MKFGNSTITSILAIATIIVASFFPSKALALWEDERCPDFTSNLCLEQIRDMIDKHAYADARDAAEVQCYSEPDVLPSERAGQRIFLNQASGCSFLDSLERFHQRQLRAFEARERAARLARLGCEQGMSALCQLQVGFLRQNLVTLAEDVRREVETGRLKAPDRLVLRDVHIARALPRSFHNDVTNHLGSIFAPGQTNGLPKCKTCRPANAKTGPKKLQQRGLQEQFALDASLSQLAGDLALTIAIRDIPSGRFKYRKVFRSGLIRDRYEAYGENAVSSPLEVKARRLDKYVPVTKVLVGIGTARIHNIAGSNLDHSRFNLQIRAMESFHQRRSEFGLMLSVHATQRTILRSSRRSATTVPLARSNRVAQSHSRFFVTQDEGGTDETAVATEGQISEEESAADLLKAYNSAFAVYGIYNRVLIGAGGSYDSIRHSANIAIGVMFATNYIAPTARLGWDIHLGRHWVLGFGAVGVNKAKVPINGELVTTPEGYGGDLILSWNL